MPSSKAWLWLADEQHTSLADEQHIRVRLLDIWNKCSHSNWVRLCQASATESYGFLSYHSGLVIVTAGGRFASRASRSSKTHHAEGLFYPRCLYNKVRYRWGFCVSVVGGAYVLNKVVILSTWQGHHGYYTQVVPKNHEWVGKRNYLWRHMKQ
jgi:hypothetical protein